jgi:hypothetical protein
VPKTTRSAPPPPRPASCCLPPRSRAKRLAATRGRRTSRCSSTLVARRHHGSGARARRIIDLTEAGAGGKRGATRIVATQDQAARLAGKGTTVTRLEQGPDVSKVRACGGRRAGRSSDPTHGLTTSSGLEGRDAARVPDARASRGGRRWSRWKDWYDDEYIPPTVAFVKQERVRPLAPSAGSGRLLGSRRPTGRATSRSSSSTRPSTPASGSPRRPTGACSSTSSTTERSATRASRELLRRVQVWIVPSSTVRRLRLHVRQRGHALWRKNLRRQRRRRTDHGRDGVDTQPQLGRQVAL